MNWEGAERERENLKQAARCQRRATAPFQEPHPIWPIHGPRATWGLRRPCGAGPHCRMSPVASTVGTHVSIPSPLSPHPVGGSVPTEALLSHLVSGGRHNYPYLCGCSSIAAAFLYTVS